MYKVTITYVLKKPADDEVISKVWSVVGAYLNAGQLVGRSTVTLGPRSKTIRVTGVAHERTSFSSRFTNRDAREGLKALACFLRGAIKTEWERFAEDYRSCACRRSTGLIFTPDALEDASPLRCMKCLARRPLYRVMKDGRSGLARLSRQWIGFYWTWMESGATEELAWRQLAEPESIFNRMVRKAMRQLEKRLRLPVYCDLLSHYCSRLDETPEATICPGCGRPWNQEMIQNRLICVPCRLFSFIPVDGQPPDWWTPLPRHRLIRP